MATIINNIEEVAKYMGSESVDRLGRDLYKYTGCGAWITWDDQSVSIGSIVEGSDAEFSKTFQYPTVGEDLDAWILELEDLTDMAWNMANEWEDEDFSESC